MARRVIVCGGRYFADPVAVQREICALADEDQCTIVVHGGASGVDTLARSVAENIGLLTEAHPADWKRYGRGAGPRRNQQMADGGADLCLAFPGGRGTADMVRRARSAGIPVKEVLGP